MELTVNWHRNVVDLICSELIQVCFVRYLQKLSYDHVRNNSSSHCDSNKVFLGEIVVTFVALIQIFCANILS